MGAIVGIMLLVAVSVVTGTLMWGIAWGSWGGVGEGIRKGVGEVVGRGVGRDVAGLGVAEVGEEVLVGVVVVAAVVLLEIVVPGCRPPAALGRRPPRSRLVTEAVLNADIRAVLGIALRGVVMFGQRALHLAVRDDGGMGPVLAAGHALGEAGTSRAVSSVA